MRVLRFESIRWYSVACLAIVGISTFGPLTSTVLGQGGYGTIKGRLVWGGAETPKPKPLVAQGQANKDPGVCAAADAVPNNSLVVDPKTKGVKYGIAFLSVPTGKNPEAVQALLKASPKVEIDQKNCDFLPHVTALHQDQTLVFKSSDPVGHNVHLTPFTNAAVNTMLPPNGSLDKKLVAEKRVIPLKCDIHPWMEGYIMVFDHPFFVVTGDDGSFEIKGVPAGTQKLVVWQQSVGYVNPEKLKGTPVKVSAGEVTDIGELKMK